MMDESWANSCVQVNQSNTGLLEALLNIVNEYNMFITITFGNKEIKPWIIDYYDAKIMFGGPNSDGNIANMVFGNKCLLNIDAITRRPVAALFQWLFMKFGMAQIQRPCNKQFMDKFKEKHSKLAIQFDECVRENNKQCNKTTVLNCLVRALVSLNQQNITFILCYYMTTKHINVVV